MHQQEFGHQNLAAPSDPVEHHLTPAPVPHIVPANGAFMPRAREAVRAGLLNGDTSVSATARSLAVSGRTLQRRLQENGTTLQKLIASVRCELAKEMLATPSMTLVQIANTLRFSAPSAFHRAFKRWTGRTPGQYRREHTSPVRLSPAPVEAIRFSAESFHGAQGA